MSAACDTIQDDVDTLARERELVQDLLQEAPPRSRPALRARLRSLTRRWAAAAEQLADCLAADEVPLPPLEVRFTGDAILTTTNTEARGPFTQPVTVRFMLDGARTTITMTTFPFIQTTFDTPLGMNTTTVTRRTGGSGTYEAGQMAIPLGLHFDHTLLLATSSDLDVTLSTMAPGSPLTAEPYGDVVLVGAGVFAGGYLGGDTGTLTLAGTFAPYGPPPTTTVPDVRESHRDHAVAEVRDAGLDVRTTGSSGADAWVHRQSPAGGAVVARGSIVTLQLRAEPVS